MKNCNMVLRKKVQKDQHLIIDKYEYFPGKEIFPSDQIGIIEQAKLIYFS